ncbi:MAG TPA: hypothetical protein VG845_01725 [Dehalococcoidia bacterium]|jgi:hypothetical protein|nr:hypothetical protein [Dehalococcoidia bacterium]
MAESDPSGETGAALTETVPEPDPKQFEQLTEMVYRLLRDELLVELERRGAPTITDRR